MMLRFAQQASNPAGQLKNVHQKPVIPSEVERLSTGGFVSSALWPEADLKTGVLILAGRTEDHAERARLAGVENARQGHAGEVVDGSPDVFASNSDRLGVPGRQAAGERSRFRQRHDPGVS